jgi:hypothetical protein
MTSKSGGGKAEQKKKTIVVGLLRFQNSRKYCQDRYFIFFHHEGKWVDLSERYL